MRTAKIVAFALALLAFNAGKEAKAQSSQRIPEQCGTQEWYLEQGKTDPQIADAYANGYKMVVQSQVPYSSARTATSHSGTVRVIPVVFHVIHSGGPENISRKQIADQLRILNADYRRFNADTINTPPHFDSLAADCLFEFHMATIDPNGNCTDGINRIYSLQTYNAPESVKSLIQWDPKKYLNIWVVTSISGSNSSGTVLGRSSLPSSFQFAPQRDGFLVRADQVGSIEFASGSRGRTATHELGHWLGLYHTFGTNADITNPKDTCNDDGVTDTPIEYRGNYSTCPTYPEIQSQCHGKTNGPYGAMYMDYMDYTVDKCVNMFSKGQKLVFDHTIATIRTQICTQANLVATGAAVVDTIIKCNPHADFTCNKQVICKGNPVVFTDMSWKGVPTSWHWVLQGTQNVVYTSQSPTVIYDTEGYYDAKLVCSNSYGQDSVVKSQKVLVYSGTATQSLPYSESFEGSSLESRGWNQYNVDGDNYKWTNSSAAAYTGSKCAAMLNFAVPDTLAKDVLYSPAIDYTSATAPLMNFKYAYARKKSTSGDILRIYYSTDCTVSWKPIATLYSRDLVTVANQSSPFQATSAQWMSKSYNIPLLKGMPNVIFKYEFTSALNGNNLYLDDIGFFADKTQDVIDTRSIAEQTLAKIYPNPSMENGSAKLALDLPSDDKVSISLFNIMGREIKVIANKTLIPAGENEIDIPLNNVKSGIYTVIIKTSSVEKHLKLSVN